MSDCGDPGAARRRLRQQVLIGLGNLVSRGKHPGCVRRLSKQLRKHEARSWGIAVLRSC